MKKYILIITLLLSTVIMSFINVQAYDLPNSTTGTYTTFGKTQEVLWNTTSTSNVYKIEFEALGSGYIPIEYMYNYLDNVNANNHIYYLDYTLDYNLYYNEQWQVIDIAMIVFLYDTLGASTSHMLVLDNQGNLEIDITLDNLDSSVYFARFEQLNVTSTDYWKGYYDAKNQYEITDFRFVFENGSAYYDYDINNSYDYLVDKTAIETEAYNIGFSQGESYGRMQTVESSLGIGYIISTAFGGMGQLLGITILPGIAIGAIVALPLIFGIMAWLFGLSKGGKK